MLPLSKRSLPTGISSSLSLDRSSLWTLRSTEPFISTRVGRERRTVFRKEFGRESTPSTSGRSWDLLLLRVSLFFHLGFQSRRVGADRSVFSFGPSLSPGKEASPEPSTREPSSATALPNSVSSDSPQAKILRLLRVLHALNSEATGLLTTPRPDTLAESAFVNNKLTAKLARQLEEPMILAR